MLALKSFLIEHTEQWMHLKTLPQTVNRLSNYIVNDNTLPIKCPTIRSFCAESIVICVCVCQILRIQWPRFLQQKNQVMFAPHDCDIIMFKGTLVFKIMFEIKIKICKIKQVTFFKKWCLILLNSLICIPVYNGLLILNMQQNENKMPPPSLKCSWIVILVIILLKYSLVNTLMFSVYKNASLDLV